MIFQNTLNPSKAIELAWANMRKKAFFSLFVRTALLQIHARYAALASALRAVYASERSEIVI